MHYPTNEGLRFLRMMLSLLWAGSALILFSTVDVESRVRTGFDVERVIPGDDSRGPFLLGATGLVSGTDSVSVDGVLLTPVRDYRLDMDRGRIELTEPLRRGQHLVVIAKRRLQIGSSVQRRTPPSPSSGKIITTVGSRSQRIQVPHRTSAGSDEGIDISGVKRLQVSVGTSSEATLSQSLRLEVSGQLDEDVRVTGFLTDRNLPLQATGRSRSIQDLERVHLEVASPRFSAGLGDLEVNFDGTAFGQYRRRLQGARLRMRGGRGEVDLFGAVSEGRWETRRITTRPGYQGPYVLATRSFGVVAGSDRVYLNGRQLRRGEGQDYVIDYDRGLVTFTPNRPITGESRLTIEYQSVDPEGRIRSVGLRGHLETGNDRLRVGTTFVRESRGVVTPASVLPSTPGQPETPSGLLTAVDGTFVPAAGLRIEGEMAWARSQPADESIVGHAAQIALSWETSQARELVSGPGAVRLTGSFRHVGDTFRPFERVDPVSREGDWGWEEEALTSAGQVSEIAARYAPLSFATVSAHLGRRTGAAAGERYGSSLAIDPGRHGAGYVSYDRIERVGGTLVRLESEASGSFGFFNPSLRFTSETAEGSAVRGSRLFYSSSSQGLPMGARIREGAISSEVGDRRISLRSDVTLAQIDQLSNAWADSVREWTHTNQLDWTPSSGLRFSGSFGQTGRRDGPGTGTRVVNLGRLNATYRPGSGLLSQHIQYRVSSTGLADRDRVFVEVADGIGSYVWEDVDGDGVRDQEEFLPEVGGNYEPFYDPTQAFEPVRESSVGTRTIIDFSRGRLRDVPGLGDLSFEVSLESERRGRASDGVSVSPWTHHSFRSDSSVVSARHDVRATTHLFRRRRLGSLRVDTRVVNGVDRMLSEGARTSEQGWVVTGKLRPVKGWDIEARAERSNRNRAGKGAFAYETTGRDLQVRNWVRFARFWQTGLTVSVGEDRESRRDLETRRLSVGPELRRAFRGKGRLTSRFDWTHVDANDDLPLFLGLADGYREGQSYRWRLGFDYRIGAYVDAYVTYDGTVRPDRPALHVGRMELRAVF